MAKNNILSEALLKDAPSQKLFLKLVDGSVTTEKLADGSVTAEKLAVDIGTSKIEITDLDTLNTEDVGDRGKPSVYTVYAFGRNVGILFVFTDGLRNVVTQVFITHQSDMSRNIFSSDNTKVFTYYRIYNLHSNTAGWEKGTWSEWSPYVDENIHRLIDNAQTKISTIMSTINSITTLSNDEVEGIWENN